MRYTVFHYEGDRFRSFSEEAFRDWPNPASYTKVADVEAPALGAVFGLTNHIDTPWTDNPEVTLPPADRATLETARAINAAVNSANVINSSVVLKRRSTSVGDVIVDENGHAWGVAGIGFTDLGPLELAIAARIDDWRTAFRNGEISSTEAIRRIDALQDLSRERGEASYYRAAGVTRSW